MSDDELLASRRQQWTAQGFDAEAISNHLNNLGGNITESIIRVENSMASAIELRRKLATWPSTWPEKAELMEALRNPTNLESCERKWRDISRKRRPWVLTAQTARARWSREGRSGELQEWVSRLEAIDESIIPYSETVISAIEQSASKEYLEEVVSTLEQRQMRRTRILEDMVEHLIEERGWALAGLTGNLETRYAEVGRIQEMDTILGGIEENVDETISLYDSETAMTILRKAKLAQQMEDFDRLTEILREAEQTSSDFQNRMDRMVHWLTELREKGLFISAPDYPEPSQLIGLEARVDEIENKIERLNITWLKLDSLLTLFPEHAGDAIALQGQVEMVERVENLLALLEQRRDEREGQSRARLQSWAVIGFDVEAFEAILNSTPRTGWLAIDEHARKIQVCKQLLTMIDSLDLSFDGAEESADWKRMIFSTEIDGDDYDFIHEGIAKRLRRNRWHREKLDEERLVLASVWPANINPKDLTLAEYEEVITKLQSGSSIAELTSSDIQRTDRLLQATVAELDIWRQIGWDVSSLDRLLERDHTELWAQLPAMRSAIKEHEKLCERLTRLPLARDPQLSDEIVAASARPDRLVWLAESIPEIAKHLASQPETAQNSPKLFSPSPPEVFAKLVPVKRLLIPSQQAEKKDVRKERIPDFEPAPMPNPQPLPIVKAEPVTKSNSISEEMPNSKAGSVQISSPIPNSETKPIVEAEPVTKSTSFIGGVKTHEKTSPSVKNTTGNVSGSDEKTVEKDPPAAQPVETHPVETKSEQKADSKRPTINWDESDSTPHNGEPTTSWTQLWADIGGSICSPPCDVRVQRLARIAVLVRDASSDDSLWGEEMVPRLSKVQEKLQDWTKLRLERRHAGLKGDLSTLSQRLAKKLQEIPGPGVDLPVMKDEFPLPDYTDKIGIEKEIRRLERVAKLTVAGSSKAIRNIA